MSPIVPRNGVPGDETAKTVSLPYLKGVRKPGASSSLSDRRTDDEKQHEDDDDHDERDSR